MLHLDLLVLVDHEDLRIQQDQRHQDHGQRIPLAHSGLALPDQPVPCVDQRRRLAVADDEPPDELRGILPQRRQYLGAP